MVLPASKSYFQRLLGLPLRPLDSSLTRTHLLHSNVLPVFSFMSM
jgi:hypothetical protein